MMALRRWLIAEYDWTGLSKRLYLSKAWEFGLLLAVAAAVVVVFALFHGPVVTDRVELNTFAPVAWVEAGDWGMACVLGLLLLSNVYRMHRHLMGPPGERRIPWRFYLRELQTLIVHGLTQKRWRDCTGKTPWLKHFLLVAGYLTMLVLVVFLLRWFQTDEVYPFWHPTRLLGYLATAAILYVSADAMIGRLRKRTPLHRHSHTTDWLFLVLLFATALTGILVHVFRLSGLPLATYSTYVLHLAIAVAMLVVEVPFGKWSHLAYRPIVMYLVKVRERAAAAAAAPTAVELPGAV
jgi:quinone-modifying oxidoreductase subunit QmoC